jgi:hypothetical protein
LVVVAGRAAVAVETGGLLEKWRGEVEKGRKRIWTWLRVTRWLFLFPGVIFAHKESSFFFR